jgi:transcriptional regulator with XRE-family HTH domain
MTTQTIERPQHKTDLQRVVSLNLKVALAIKGETQTALSRAIEITPSALSQKMKNKSVWTIEDMEKAGQFLNIAPAKFLEPNGLLVAGSGFEPETSGL